jgi:hypothetical protein
VAQLEFFAFVQLDDYLEAALLAGHRNLIARSIASVEAESDGGRRLKPLMPAGRLRLRRHSGGRRCGGGLSGGGSFGGKVRVALADQQLQTAHSVGIRLGGSGDRFISHLASLREFFFVEETIGRVERGGSHHVIEIYQQLSYKNAYSGHRAVLPSTRFPFRTFDHSEQPRASNTVASAVASSAL